MHIIVRMRKFLLTLDTIVILRSNYSNFCVNKKIMKYISQRKLTISNKKYAYVTTLTYA